MLFPTQDIQLEHPVGSKVKFWDEHDDYYLYGTVAGHWVPLQCGHQHGLSHRVAPYVVKLNQPDDKGVIMVRARMILLCLVIVIVVVLHTVTTLTNSLASVAFSHIYRHG